MHEKIVCRYREPQSFLKSLTSLTSLTSLICITPYMERNVPALCLARPPLRLPSSLDALSHSPRLIAKWIVPSFVSSSTSLLSPNDLCDETRVRLNARKPPAPARGCQLTLRLASCACISSLVSYELIIRCGQFGFGSQTVVAAGGMPPFRHHAFVSWPASFHRIRHIVSIIF